MRTTIDLPDDLLDTVRVIARGQRQTIGQTVASLVRFALDDPAEGRIKISPRTGLPVIRLGHTTTLEDVKALEDDE